MADLGPGADWSVLAAAVQIAAVLQPTPVRPFSGSRHASETGHSLSQSSPVSPSPTGSFGKTRSGTGFGKAPWQYAPRGQFCLAFPSKVPFRESIRALKRHHEDHVATAAQRRTAQARLCCCARNDGDPGSPRSARGGRRQGKKVGTSRCGIGARGAAVLRPDQAIEEAVWSGHGRMDEGDGLASRRR